MSQINLIQPPRTRFSQTREERSNTREARRESREEQRSIRIENRRSRRADRAGGDDAVSIQPVPNPQTPPTPPASNAPSTPSSQTTRSMAEKYVDIYTKQSGQVLSAEGRESMVKDVESFYSSSGTRTARLKTLVDEF